MSNLSSALAQKGNLSFQDIVGAVPGMASGILRNIIMGTGGAGASAAAKRSNRQQQEALRQALAMDEKGRHLATVPGTPRSQWR